MAEKKKRKGYATVEQQMAATKRYLDNNPEAKERALKSRTKSTAKRFIREFATKEDLEELKQMIEERLKGQ